MGKIYGDELYLEFIRNCKDEDTKLKYNFCYHSFCFDLEFLKPMIINYIIYQIRYEYDEYKHTNYFKLKEKVEPIVETSILFYKILFRSNLYAYTSNRDLEILENLYKDYHFIKKLRYNINNKIIDLIVDYQNEYIELIKLVGFNNIEPDDIEKLEEEYPGILNIYELHRDKISLIINPLIYSLSKHFLNIDIPNDHIIKRNIIKCKNF